MDIVRPSFKGQAAGQSEQSMLAGAVSHLPGVALDRRAAGDVDDSTPAGSDHKGQDQPAEEYGCREVDPEHPLPVVEILLDDGALVEDPGVVDQQDVSSAYAARFYTRPVEVFTAQREEFEAIPGTERYEAFSSDGCRTDPANPSF